MSVGGRHQVDYEQEAWARALLVSSGRPNVADRVRAYRILTRVNPGSYQARLAQALVEWTWLSNHPTPQSRLVLLEEAAAAARAVPAGEPGRSQLIVDVLNSYQTVLYAMGRRAEGLAVREEMAAASREAIAAGQHQVVGGLRTLAHGLAEQGRHSEAAALLSEVVDLTHITDSSSAPIWDQLSLTDQLDAAGQAEAAVAVLDEVLDEERAQLVAGRTSVSDVFHLRVWHAVLLDRAQRPDDAHTARRDALRLVRQLAANGEPSQWSGSQYTTAGILLAVQARDAEPVTPGQPQPAYGFDMAHWSQDLRDRYIDDTGAPSCGGDAGRPDTLLHAAQTATHPAECAALIRRLAIRIAAYCLWQHGHEFLEPALPAVDGSVIAARHWHTEASHASRQALARALTDRTMVLIAGDRYSAALTDYEEALNLIDTT